MAAPSHRIATAAGAMGIRTTAEQAATSAKDSASSSGSGFLGALRGATTGAARGAGTVAGSTAATVAEPLTDLAESGASAVRWWSAAGIAAAIAFAFGAVAFIVFQVRKGLS